MTISVGIVDSAFPRLLYVQQYHGLDEFGFCSDMADP
jgi:hypothetical protein